nr:MAG TPA: hypothetical protein [Caudoviricetes sp.]
MIYSGVLESIHDIVKSAPVTLQMIREIINLISVSPTQT